MHGAPRATRGWWGWKVVMHGTHDGFLAQPCGFQPSARWYPLVAGTVPPYNHAGFSRRLGRYPLVAGTVPPYNHAGFSRFCLRYPANGNNHGNGLPHKT